MKNTRIADLNRLEADRDAGSKRAGRLLEKVYKQTLDPEIERLRKMLIDAHKARDLEKVEIISAELRKRG